MWAKLRFFLLESKPQVHRRKSLDKAVCWMEGSSGKKHEASGTQRITRTSETRSKTRSGGQLTKVSQRDVAQHIEASLLELVGQPKQRQGTPGVPHQEQQLGSPEFHMILPHIQSKQVFTDLGTGRGGGEEGINWATPTRHLRTGTPTLAEGRGSLFVGWAFPGCLLPVPPSSEIPQPGEKARPG